MTELAMRFTQYRVTKSTEHNSIHFKFVEEVCQRATKDAQ